MTSIDSILDAALILDGDEMHQNIVSWNIPVDPVQRLDELAPLNAYQVAMNTIEYDMWTTYKLPVTFLDAFVKHASNRTSDQIKNNEYILPDGFMDKDVLHAQVMETIHEYNMCSGQLKEKAQDTLTKLEEIEFIQRAQSLGSVTNPKQWDHQVQKSQIIGEFSQHVNRIYELRHKLSVLADVKPIDAKLFFCRMHEWQLNYTVLKMKTRFPEWFN
jgi:hypothetical protein